MRIGRNDPCPCGSGLRFKKCCGIVDTDAPGKVLPSPPPVAGLIMPTAPPGARLTVPFANGATNAVSPPLPEKDSAALLKRAIGHHQSGDLMQAASLYQQILAQQPGHADALHLSGLICQTHGDTDKAIDLITQAIAIRPTAAFHNNLGNVLQAKGALQTACRHYEEAMSLQPDFAPGPFNIGNCLLAMGEPDRAAQWYERALAIQPEFVEAACGIGNALLEQGLLEQACDRFRQALTIDPHNMTAHLHLGQTLMQQGLSAHAVVAYEAALRSDETDPDAHYGLANAYFAVGELQQAINSYRQAMTLRHDFAEAHYNLGNVYKTQDRYREAMQCYDAAVKCRPDFFAARWAACMAQIPVLYKRIEEIAVARIRYREALERLARNMRLDDPAAIDAAASAVGSMQPFYLAYQGHDDRELQMLYGDLVSQIMTAKYPQWSTAPAPVTTSDKRLRVGFVSAFFFSHSNWKLPIKGWVGQLDREKFSLHGYYTGKAASKDAQTDIARDCFERFVEDASSVEQLAAAIRADQLDVLIYPEIGMSPLTASLAALRLAPVQCNAWGHPQTSGLPSIDYFLSSDLMEPDDADRHYSEKLVRLPNLSVYCELAEHAPTGNQRSDYGLADDCPLYFCAQSLFKYLPQYDRVFAAIAEKVGQCQFAFIDNPQSPELTQRFIDRIAQEFRRKGMQPEDYVVMLPHLGDADFAAVNQLADVFLDSIGWNGCNSTLEALSCNLPVVTLPGQLMRGLHSHAMLKMIGMDETVAHDIASYVDIAARLGSNPALRRTLSDKIARDKNRLARDQSAIDGLENFLLQTATHQRRQ